MAEPKPWTVHHTETVADCRVFTVQGHDSRRADGLQSRFFGLQSPDWVNVIAVTDDDRIVMIRQWRHGIAGPILEIPGGMVDEGEDPKLAAARELYEETGYRAVRWTKLGAVNPNPALFGNRLHSYLAEGCTHDGPGEADPHEETLVELYDRPAIDELMAAGKIDHALVLAAFLWWRLRGP